MQIPREMVLARLRAEADADSVQRAERELPEKVDPDRDAALLRRFDVDPGDLVESFGGQSPEVG